METTIKTPETSCEEDNIARLLKVGKPSQLRDDLREIIGVYMLNEEKDMEQRLEMYKTAHALDQFLLDLESDGF